MLGKLANPRSAAWCSRSCWEWDHYKKIKTKTKIKTVGALFTHQQKKKPVFLYHGEWDNCKLMGVCIYSALDECLGRCLAIIGRDPSVSKTNQFT